VAVVGTIHHKDVCGVPAGSLSGVVFEVVSPPRSCGTTTPGARSARRTASPRSSEPTFPGAPQSV
jgi:hypothetical protein